MILLMSNDMVVLGTLWLVALIDSKLWETLQFLCNRLLRETIQLCLIVKGKWRSPFFFFFLSLCLFPQSPWLPRLRGEKLHCLWARKFWRNEFFIFVLIEIQQSRLHHLPFWVSDCIMVFCYEGTSHGGCHLLFAKKYTHF